MFDSLERLATLKVLEYRLAEAPVADVAVGVIEDSKREERKATIWARSSSPSLRERFLLFFVKNRRAKEEGSFPTFERDRRTRKISIKHLAVLRIKIWFVS